jgi:hypothetical protein
MIWDPNIGNPEHTFSYSVGKSAQDKKGDTEHLISGRGVLRTTWDAGADLHYLCMSLPSPGFSDFTLVA